MIKFTVKNGAYEPLIVVFNIQAILLKNGLSLGGNTDQREALEKLDLSHYYLNEGTGAKITKSIKKILLTAYSKERVDAVYPKVCKEIAELYSPAIDITAHFGDKSLLGQGIYEPHETCFNEDGCNYTSALFLDKFKRVKALYLDAYNTKARCIVYFAGGRNIYLTNFYYRSGFPQNKRIFVEAVRRLLGITKVSFKSEKFPLPIYQNRDCILVHTDRSKVYGGTILYPCPNCNAKVPKLFHDNDGTTYLIGCSSECLKQDKKDRCCVCNDQLDEYDYCHNDDNELFCSDCYNERYFYCARCDNESCIEDAIGDYCSTCATACSNCGEAVLDSNLYDHDLCGDCYSDLYDTCSNCGDEIEVGSGDWTMIEGEIVCSSCYEDNKEANNG